MREILFLAHRLPFPPDRGDKIRSWNLLKALSRLGRVHLACFADSEAELAGLEPLRLALGGALGEACVEIRRRGMMGAGLRALGKGRAISLSSFESPALSSFVDHRLATGRTDAVVAFSGQMAQFVPPGWGGPFLMDFGDVDSEKFAQYARTGWGPMRWIHLREAKRLGAFEKATAGRASLSTFVSAAEADLFRRLTGATRVAALSNGIDSDFFDPAADFPRLAGDGEPILLFTGQMDYRPNVDAVRWFAREVLPKLRRGRLVIAGRAPVPSVRRLKGPRIQVTGAVEDIRSWFAAADIVVAPLRIARGIQNKVLEAMAMARPVVASPAAFEGIEAEAGRDLVVADDPERFASAIEALLDDESARQAMGVRARQKVLDLYDWEARLSPLATMLFGERWDRAA